MASPITCPFGGAKLDSPFSSKHCRVQTDLPILLISFSDKTPLHIPSYLSSTIGYYSKNHTFSVKILHSHYLASLHNFLSKP